MSYLGLDLSSQSLSGLIIDETTSSFVAEHTINFTKDLPEYKTENGFVRGENLQVHSYPAMFLDALDLLLEAMRAHLPEVQAVSLSAQQHASVYLNEGFEQALKSLNPNQNLKSQLFSSLSREITPIWMDHSTTTECEEMTQKVGEQNVIERSGSPYCERFTAAQIRKFYKTESENYDQTQHIHLVSSFMTSVLAGQNSSIDTSDGAGMNLMNLGTSQWDPELLEACAPNLATKMPSLAPASATAGKISTYFSEKYGFSKNCDVILGSGDNPNSLIGCGAAESGTAVISLGTSDTFFSANGSNPIDTKGLGHVFGNPAGGFMSLICFRNGSLSREELLAHYGLDWQSAEEQMLKTAPCPIEEPILPYLVDEVVPPVKTTTQVSDFKDMDSAKGMTALIESQFLSLQLQARQHLPEVKLIRLTGGASRNKAIAQIISDIFQAKVECIQVSNSAALGAAMRAGNAHRKNDWSTWVSAFSQVGLSFEPNASNAQAYAQKSEQLQRLIQKALA